LAFNAFLFQDPVQNKRTVGHTKACNAAFLTATQQCRSSASTYRHRQMAKLDLGKLYKLQFKNLQI